jgi:hypothetical protein
MTFVKIFKGLEDKISQVEAVTNEWIRKNSVRVLDIKVTLAHETGGRAGSGDLVLVLTYEADQPLA